MRISHWSSDVCSSDLGDPAVHALAEESVSVARDPAIDGVAQRGGDQAEDAGDCPGKAEPLIDGEDGIAVAAYPRPLDEEKRRRILGIDAVTAADRVSSYALDRGEPGMRRPVVAPYDRKSTRLDSNH